MTAASDVGAGFVQRQKLFMLPKKVQELSVPSLLGQDTPGTIPVSFPWRERDICALHPPAVTRAGFLQKPPHYHPGTVPQPFPSAKEGTPSQCSVLGWERQC